MTSVKQLTANRTNGKKSTGPKTKNGKDRAKMNALKHGLTAAQGVLIEGEDPEEFEAWCADFIAKYRPTTALRHGLVLQLAVESWRLQRVAGIEGTFIRACQEETAAEIEASFDDAYYQPLRNEAENRCYESFGHSIDAIIRAKFDGTYDSRFEEYFEQVQAEALARGHTPPERKLTKDERAQAHQASGHTLILVSASLRYLLKPVINDLGFHHLLCTDLEIAENGALTGKTNGPICINHHKRVAVENLAHEKGIRLDQSYAYGNHHSDIPMLEAVGKPAAVEPTMPLKKIAVKKGWPILTFR